MFKIIVLILNKLLISLTKPPSIILKHEDPFTQKKIEDPNPNHIKFQIKPHGFSMLQIKRAHGCYRWYKTIHRQDTKCI
jgi:hypothetical protein